MKRKPKTEVLPPGTRYTPPLTSVGNVLREQARTYRQVLNNRIPSDEGARRMFMLREIRSSVEAAQAAAVIDQVASPMVYQVIVTPVRSGTYLSDSDLADIRAGKMPPLALAEPEAPEPSGKPAAVPVDGDTVVAFRRPAEPLEPDPVESELEPDPAA